MHFWYLNDAGEHSTAGGDLKMDGVIEEDILSMYIVSYSSNTVWFSSFVVCGIYFISSFALNIPNLFLLCCGVGICGQISLYLFSIINQQR